MDERISQEEAYPSLSDVWTKKGFEGAVRMLLSEKNTLFESLFNKLKDYPELNQTIQTILFTGKVLHIMQMRHLLILRQCLAL